MKINNHWSKQNIAHERKYFADNESEMRGAYNEAALVEHMPKLSCETCGADAWFHSGIGAYRCLRGHLLIRRVNAEDFWTS